MIDNCGDCCEPECTTDCGRILCVDIVKEYLIKNGYEGLLNEDEDCGCCVDDLMPCDGAYGQCSPAYKHPGNAEYDFLMMFDKHTEDCAACKASKEYDGG